MVQEKNLTIRQASWNPASGQLLEKAMCADPLTGINGLRYKVEAGKAALFEVLDDCYLCAAAVLELVPQATGTEGVVVAVGGRLSGVSLTRQVFPAIEKLFVGCSAIRFNTHRRGLVRELQKQGYVLSEVVMTKRKAANG